MKHVFFCLLLLMANSARAQDACEIHVFDIANVDGVYSLLNGRNVTRRAGYDNQPSFHPADPVLYYSSFDDDGRSDIKSHNLRSGETSNFTRTSEREYSPTVTPDGKFVSCIIQRDDGAQDLGKYPIGGGKAVVLIDDLIVGYHAWMDENSILLFVLGEPATLRIRQLSTGEDKIVAENIGRSLHKIPGQDAMSFVHKNPDGPWMIKRLDCVSLKISDIALTIEGKEDLTWMPDGKILMSDGTKILWLDPGASEKWNPLMIPNGNLTGITRLAVSPDGKQVAVVADEQEWQGNGRSF